MAYESWEDVHPQEGKQLQAFQMIGEVDFMLWGGARFGGKSELLSMIPPVFAGDKYYRGIFFRRQYDEIMGANGLWEKAENMYPLFGAGAHISNKCWTFPSGARQLYRHMYHETDKESHRGKGYSVIGFDEIDQFSKDQVTFLMTCLRSEADMDSFCVGTLNPNPASWCLPLIEYYLDADGLPDPAKAGDIRWFIVKDGDFLFGPSEEWFKENHPECVWVSIPNQEKKVYIRPKRFTYMFFNIFDNPLGLAANPVYLSELNNLPDHERDTQLWGNWYSVPRGANYWQREWLNKVDTIPTEGQAARGWDKAAVEPNDVNKHPDFTAGSAKIYKSRAGLYTIVGDYIEDLKDDVNNKTIYGKFRKRPGARDLLIQKQGFHDGVDCHIVLPVDPGAAGKSEYQSAAAALTEVGLRCYQDPAPTNNSKLLKFTPFAVACENGLVSICERSFKNKETLEAFYLELENFDGERSTSSKKDDVPDCVATTFNYVSASRVMKFPPRNQLTFPTQASKVLQSSEAPRLTNEGLPQLSDLSL